jgi:hypothetical protein
VVETKSIRGELNIDTCNREVNRHIYDSLYTHKEEIERAVREELDWEPLWKRKGPVGYNTIWTLGDGKRPRPELPKMQEQTLEVMTRLATATRQFVQQIR